MKKRKEFFFFGLQDQNQFFSSVDTLKLFQIDKTIYNQLPVQLSGAETLIQSLAPNQIVTVPCHHMNQLVRILEHRKQSLQK